MARAKFTELLQTLAGVRGLNEKFVTGFETATELDLIQRMTGVFGQSIGSFAIHETSRQMSRAVAAGDAFNAALPGERVLAKTIPITRGLKLPGGLRKRFVADVAVTVQVRIGPTDVQVTKLIEVTADRTLSPDELREQALASTEDMFKERGYGVPALTTAKVDVKWVMLTR